MDHKWDLTTRRKTIKIKIYISSCGYIKLITVAPEIMVEQKLMHKPNSDYDF